MKDQILKQFFFLILGLSIGIIAMYGIFEIYVMLNAFQNNAFILLMSLILSLFSGLLFGTLLVLKDILFPSKFKILTKIGNPLTEEELELIWKWSNGSTAQELGVHRMQLNRVVRKYCKVTLQKRK